MSSANNRWNATPLPLWVHDFTSGTAELSDAAVGRYIRLLCYQWVKGSVPSNPDHAAELHLFKPAEQDEGTYEARVTRTEEILECYFTPSGARARNDRLESARGNVKARSAQAKKAAEERWSEGYEGHLYLMAVMNGPKSMRAAKVGYSDNPESRARALLCPVSVQQPEVLAFTKSSCEVKEMERVAHQRLSPYRIRGEWFNFHKAVELFRSLDEVTWNLDVEGEGR